MHICRSTIEPAPRLFRRVCGICMSVHDGCQCYAVKDRGRVRRENARGSRWTAFLGLDLWEPEYLGCYPTRREAAAAILEWTP
jgi:hypothetical protein